MENTDSSFTSTMALAQMGISSVPSCYILPPEQRPNISQNPPFSSADLPVIDLSMLENPFLRTLLTQKVRFACKEFGFFQVINHGIPLSVISHAIDTAAEFFDLPNESKMHLASTNVHEPVRYGTSLNQVNDKIYFWRDFIKHYCRPISSWIHLWPSNPPSYRKKMGDYAEAVHILHVKLMEVALESLGLRTDYLRKDIEQGFQVMAANCYPACPEPNLALGMPPHSDYGSLTIIQQTHNGLEIMDRDQKWQSVPVIPGGLVVQLGDQMEVLSNGRSKSVVHQATLNPVKRRLSIASIHSLALEKKVQPAPELVDEQHPLSYREGSFRDFLDFISGNDILELKYIDTLRKNQSIEYNATGTQD